MLTVVSSVAYIIFFSIGPGKSFILLFTFISIKENKILILLGAIPWLITSELFGSDSRGKATSIAVFVNWFSNFLVTVSFIYIEVKI
jgi:hypothetical protein